jgi:hypothetical protein
MVQICFVNRSWDFLGDRESPMSQAERLVLHLNDISKSLFKPCFEVFHSARCELVWYVSQMP